MSGGTYTLLIRVEEPITVTFGAAGSRVIEAGVCGYTGSAPNSSFARVSRHLELARGKSDTRHWHIDYLLGHEKTEVIGYARTEADVECAVAPRLADKWSGVSGLGASDCDCDTHLSYTDEGGAVEQLRSAYEEVTDSWGYVSRS